jgi:hypothetical protein
MKTQKAVMKNIGLREQVKVNQAVQPCTCGCAPCEQTCCTLDCLVQPRFFCGQLLTDADLTQLMKWSKAKFSLSRRLHGWGVVCGLELSLDRQNPTHVIVHPGYAIDCCGRDIVACEEASIDLSVACPVEVCLDVEGSSFQLAGKQGQQEVAYEGKAGPEEKAFDPQTIFAGGTTLDLWLHYKTEDSDLLVPLRRDNCGGGAQCEASRTKEIYSITAEPAGGDQEEDPYKSWREGLEKRQQPYLELVNYLQGKIKREEPVQAWLLEWLDRHPAEEFGFLRDWTAAVVPSQLPDELPKIVTLLRLDALRAWLRCGCPGCSTDMGIKLGRAWLSSPNAPGGTGCRVQIVDYAPPYRRMLRAEACLPTGEGCINLARYLWMPWDEAQKAMRSDGVRYGESGNRYQLEQLDWEMWKAIYTATEFHYCPKEAAETTAYPILLDTGTLWGARVAGFTAAT